LGTVGPGETIDDKNAKLLLGLKNHYTEVCVVAEQKQAEFEESVEQEIKNRHYVK